MNLLLSITSKIQNHSTKNFQTTQLDKNPITKNTNSNNNQINESGSHHTKKHHNTDDDEDDKQSMLLRLCIGCFGSLSQDGDNSSSSDGSDDGSDDDDADEEGDNDEKDEENDGEEDLGEYEDSDDGSGDGDDEDEEMDEQQMVDAMQAEIALEMAELAEEEDDDQKAIAGALDDMIEGLGNEFDKHGVNDGGIEKEIEIDNQRELGNLNDENDDAENVELAFYLEGYGEKVQGDMLNQGGCDSKNGHCDHYSGSQSGDKGRGFGSGSGHENGRGYGNKRNNSQDSSYNGNFGNQMGPGSSGSSVIYRSSRYSNDRELTMGTIDESVTEDSYSELYDSQYYYNNNFRMDNDDDVTASEYTQPRDHQMSMDQETTTYND